MDRIAFVTQPAAPALYADDATVLPHLGGVRVDAKPWGSPAPHWAGYAAVVLRSCWDYHLAPGPFLGWVDELEAAGVPLLNPPAAIRWNVDKRYLQLLEARGCPVVPTAFVDAVGPDTLSDVLARRGWRRAVVKPAVSAGAYRTFVTTAAEARAHEAAFADVRSAGSVLVQPFLDEVVEEGEWSLVFLEGAFSHAVLKRPKRGDYRVQEQFGGVAAPAVPPHGTVEAAHRAVEAAREATGADLLYARVDGVVLGGGLHLMELELIEPVLFLRGSTGAAARFAHALLRRAAPERVASDTARPAPAPHRP